jgi:tRNA(Ile2) C34 agmatinyltransferase TiaS
MNIRRFFIVSLGLAIIAVGLHVAALSQYGHGARAIARAVTQPESQRAFAKQAARVYRERGSLIAIAGLGFALGSLAFVVVSARRHEPAWRSVTVAFLAFYFLLQFAQT